MSCPNITHAAPRVPAGGCTPPMPMSGCPATVLCHFLTYCTSIFDICAIALTSSHCRRMVFIPHHLRVLTTPHASMPVIRPHQDPGLVAPLHLVQATPLSAHATVAAPTSHLSPVRAPATSPIMVQMPPSCRASGPHVAPLALMSHLWPSCRTSGPHVAPLALMSCLWPSCHASGHHIMPQSYTTHATGPHAASVPHAAPATAPCRCTPCSRCVLAPPQCATAIPGTSRAPFTCPSTSHDLTHVPRPPSTCPGQPLLNGWHSGYPHAS